MSCSPPLPFLGPPLTVHAVRQAPTAVPKITNKWLKGGKWQVGNRGELLPATLHLKAPFDPDGSRIMQ